MVESYHKRKRNTSAERAAAPRLTPAEIAARARALELARNAEHVLRALKGQDSWHQPAISHHELRRRFSDRQWQRLVVEDGRRLHTNEALLRAIAVMSRLESPMRLSRPIET